MIKVGTLVRHILDVEARRSEIGIVTGMDICFARVRWPDGSASMEHYEILDIVWSNEV
jgi:hypothetical protein